MGLALTATASAALWIVLWAVGLKAFDGFLIGLVLVLIAATVRIAAPYLPKREA
jgi:hypothetical protein